jgi:predicted TIM-barrel fold metal-dependent hydrolase
MGTGGSWMGSGPTPSKVGSRQANVSSAPTKSGTRGRFADVRPGGYLPAEHIKDNEADGIYGSVLYPTEGLLLFSVPDSELLSAVFRPYNDWIAEVCRASPRRLKGTALIGVDDIPGAIKELEHARKLGLAGAMITVYPAEDRSRTTSPSGRRPRIWRCP